MNVNGPGCCTSTVLQYLNNTAAFNEVTGPYKLTATRGADPLEVEHPCGAISSQWTTSNEEG